MKQLIAGVSIAMALGFAAVSTTRPVILPFISEPAAGEVASTTAPQPEVASTSALSTTAPTATVPATTVQSTTVPATAVSPTAVPSTTTSVYPPGVLIIGDSILEGLNVLSYRFGPNTVYDTEVARSVLQLEAVLAEYEPPANIVIHLGTNGWWPETAESFSNMLVALEDRRVVLVNVSVDRPYTEIANSDLAALADEHDHVTLVDWNGIASSDIVRDDGYHPNLQGYEVLGRLIADALGLPASFVLAPPAEQSDASADLLD
ncbi:MAG: hypothetical protein ACN4GZ_13340 [Acidimicrobiales bacterium]